MKGEKSGEYLLVQTSERYPTKLNISYVLDYTGKIISEGNSSRMSIHFPLSKFGFLIKEKCFFSGFLKLL